MKKKLGGMNKKSPNMKRLFESFRRYTEEVEIEEATRASKEGVKLPSTLEQLKKYVVADSERPTHFIQFSSINKLGMNPSSRFKTPMGIYSYPLIETMFNQLKKGDIPFASGRDYIIVFKPKSGSNILVAGVDSINHDQFNSMAEKLFTKEAARLAGNFEFYEEANAYRNGYVLSQTVDSLLKQSMQEPGPGHYGPDYATRRKNALRDVPGPKESKVFEYMADGFLDWMKARFYGLPRYSSIMKRLRTDEKTSGDWNRRSPVWGIVIHIFQDWASYPYEQVGKYSEVMRDYKAITGKKRLRRMREQDYQEDREKTQRWRITRYNRYKREFENLEKIFTKKHYDIVVEWLGQYLEEPDNAFEQVAKDALMDTSLGLKLKDIADLNRDHLHASWKKTIPGDFNEPLPSPERMTSAWSSMETYARNKTYLGKLWYGSMVLAKNRHEDGDSKRGPNRGMKVWRTILQRLWGIDGIVDMGSVGPASPFSAAIIHSSEPIQAVFFSKSALEHVTTLKNTETPKAIHRRKVVKQKKIADMLIPVFKKEYNELYGGIIKSWDMPQDLAQKRAKDEAYILSPENILNSLLRLQGRLQNVVTENKEYIWWKTLSELSLEKPENISDQQGMVDATMLAFRRQISLDIFETWERLTRPTINYKIGWLYRYHDMALPYKDTEDFYTTMTRASYSLRRIYDFHFSRIDQELKSKPFGIKAKNGMIDKQALIRARDKIVQVHDSIDKIYKKEREKSLGPNYQSWEWQEGAREVRDYLKGLPK
jgi:hypothetical protein